VLGFTSAVAAYGAFFIPKSYGTSIDLTGGAEARAVALHPLLPNLHRRDLAVLFAQECRDSLLIAIFGETS